MKQGDVLARQGDVAGLEQLAAREPRVGRKLVENYASFGLRDDACAELRQLLAECELSGDLVGRAEVLARLGELR